MNACKGRQCPLTISCNRCRYKSNQFVQHCDGENVTNCVEKWSGPLQKVSFSLVVLTYKYIKNHVLKLLI
ncbi:hypothetical protein ALT785_330019 [Alteromonas infernus]